MGTFSVPVQIGDPAGQQWETLDAFVDTGATFTVIPRTVWDRLGLRSAFRMPFELADGRQVEHEVASAQFRLSGQERVGYVVAAEGDITPLLGAITLETFSVAVDPVHKRLIPVPGLML